MRLLNLSYATPAGHRALDFVNGAKDLQVDKARASATGVFTSTSRDRVGDVLETSGIDVSAHRKNPIAMFQHGMDYRDPDGQKPIGIHESPEGQYAVVLHDGYGTATTYFSQATLLAEQICALVMEKTIRAQSIGFRELKTERVYDEETYVGTHILECELLEISWVIIPAQQDAVRGLLSRDLCGKALAPGLRAALLPFAEPARAWANGANLGGSIVRRKSEPANPDLDGDDSTEQEKFGSKALRAFHKALCKASAVGRKAQGGLDDDSEVGSAMGDVADAVDDHADSLKALHAEKYKDEEPLGEMPDHDEKDDNEDESGDQKMLSRLAKVEAKLKGTLREQEADEWAALSAEDRAAMGRLRRVESQLKHEQRLLNVAEAAAE